MKASVLFTAGGAIMKKSILFLWLIGLLATLAYASVTIYGTITYEGAGLSGVVMSGLPGNPATDSSGYYSASVDDGWSGTVTPTLSGYLFDPVSSSYSNVTSNQIADYTASMAYFKLESFPLPSEFNVFPLAVIPIDFDSDGAVYLLITFVEGSQSVQEPIRAYHNDGSGHFTDVTDQVLGDIQTWGISWHAVADFNGDGREDVLLVDGGLDRPPWTGGRLLLLIQQPDGTLVDEADTRLPSSARWAHASSGDIDGDGDIDICMVNYVLINDGTGHFTKNTTRIPVIDYFDKNYLLDADKDGDLDLVLACEGTNRYYDALLINDGTGYFNFAPDSAMPPHYGSGTYATADVFIADVNGDGWPDIVRREIDYTTNDNKAQLLLNNQDGTFRDASANIPQTAIPMGYGRLDGDFNGDGWLDLILSNHGCPKLFINTGHGLFEDVSDIVFPWGEDGLFTDVADIDNDGDPDILVLSSHNTMNWWLDIYRNQRPYPAGCDPLPYPQAPVLTSPSNGETVSTTSPLFEWLAVESALSYRLQIRDDSQTVVDQKDITANSWHGAGLKGNTAYSWKVKAVNTRGEGPWSETRSFMTPNTVLLSGQVTHEGSGVPRVIMRGLPGNPQTDSEGNYSVEVAQGWSGTATPAQNDYNFYPESTAYVNVTAAGTQDYLAYHGIPQHERKALIAVFNATNGDLWGGTSWKKPPLESDGFASYGTEGTWAKVVVEDNAVNVLWLTEISGFFPPEIGNLSNLARLGASGGVMTGSITNTFANLTRLSSLEIMNNKDLKCNLPDFLGNRILSSLILLGNGFTGTIPPLFCNAGNLSRLLLQGNMLSGPIPASFANLKNLSPPWLDLGYNALYTDNAELRAFLSSKDPDWEDTQTVAPTNVQAEVNSGTAVTISWSPIKYTGHTGGYRVFHSTTSGGPYTFHAQTADKTASSQQVTGLTQGTKYYFIVQTRTDPHGAEWQFNTLDSEYSAEVSATTTLTSVTISGTVTASGVGLSGVVMSGLTGNPSTNGTGYYTGTVDVGWTGTITPTLSGYSFTPPSTFYSNLTSNVTTNYTAGVIPTLYALNVQSTPDTGIGITVSPDDYNGDGDGNTNFTRSYASGTVVTLTAPATFNSKNFSKWTIDGTDNTNASIQVTMSAEHTVVAVYISSGTSYVYGLNEASGAAFNDANASGNNGTLYGGFTRVASTIKDNSGATGRAVKFNGTSGYGRLPSQPIANGPFTIALWAKRAGNGAGSANPLIQTCAPGTNNGYLLTWLNNNSITARVSTANGSSSLVFPSGSTNIWTHIALIYDLSQAKLFINGQVVQHVAQTGGLVIPNWSFSIGGQGDGTSPSYFNGQLDGLKIYARALTDVEVLSLYQAERPAGGALLNAPVLISPSTGATGLSTSVSLQWQDTNTSPNESGYQVRLKAAGGTYKTYNLASNATSYPATGLTLGKTYYWNVRARGSGTTTKDSGWANGGLDFRFTVLTLVTLNAPVLLAPPNNATGVSLNPTLQWQDTNSSPNENGYQVRLKPAGGSYKYFNTLQDADSYIASGLLKLKVYSWNVKALGNGTTTKDSAWANGGVDRKFTTGS